MILAAHLRELEAEAIRLRTLRISGRWAQVHFHEFPAAQKAFSLLEGQEMCYFPGFEWGVAYCPFFQEVKYGGIVIYNNRKLSYLKVNKHPFLQLCAFFSLNIYLFIWP